MKQIMSNKEYYTRKLLECYTEEELFDSKESTGGLLFIYILKEAEGYEVDVEAKKDKFMEGCTFKYKGGKAKW